MVRRIVVDSSSNMNGDNEVIEVKTVPLKIITQEKEYTDSDELDVEAMVSALEEYKGKTTTSCPNSNDWICAYRGADEVFVLTITSKLSGSYTAAMVARDEYLKENPDAKVFVLDTLSTGPQMELVTEKIKELSNSGASYDDIIKGIKGYNKKLGLIFSLESLHNLACNGRVSSKVATLAGVLGIRMIGKASEEGTLQPITKAHGKKKAILSIYNEMVKAGFKGGKVRIVHCLNELDAKELLSRIRKEYPKADIIIDKCKGLCSFYAERGGMIVGFEK